MELYIRGAWRTFSTQPPRKRPKNSDVEHSPSSDANELLSLRASSARLLGSEPESQAADNVLAKSVPSRQSQCVQTRNVGDLKAFFEALMGRRVAFDEEGQYKLSINGSRCLVIAGALDAGDAKGLHVSKPDTKTVHVDFPDILSLQRSYRHHLDRGLRPSRILANGKKFRVQYCDPENNVVELRTFASENAVEINDWTEVDGRMLFDTNWPAARGAEISACKSDAVRVKQEPDAHVSTKPKGEPAK